MNWTRMAAVSFSVTVAAQAGNAQDRTQARSMVVSKNGTNEVHGSGLFKATRPGLNAYQRYNGPLQLPGEAKPTNLKNFKIAGTVAFFANAMNKNN